MKNDNAAIPAGMAWSSPFTTWQGTLAEVSSLDLTADVTARALAQRGVDPGQIDGLVLGWTIPQPDIFYGAPTLAAGISGPMISQACATSVACLAYRAALRSVRESLADDRGFQRRHMVDVHIPRRRRETADHRPACLADRRPAARSLS